MKLICIIVLGGLCIMLDFDRERLLEKARVAERIAKQANSDYFKVKHQLQNQQNIDGFLIQAQKQNQADISFHERIIRDAKANGGRVCFDVGSTSVPPQN